MFACFQNELHAEYEEVISKRWNNKNLLVITQQIWYVFSCAEWQITLGRKIEENKYVAEDLSSFKFQGENRIYSCIFIYFSFLTSREKRGANHTLAPLLWFWGEPWPKSPTPLPPSPPLNRPLQFTSWYVISFYIMYLLVRVTML